MTNQPETLYNKDDEAVCSVCEIKKPRSEYFFDIYASAFLACCKDCKRARNRAQYQKFKAKRLEKNEQYRLANIEKVRELHLAQQRRTKSQWKARYAVSQAVKNGTFNRKPCEVCSVDKTQFHHSNGYDEANYLVGSWLCSAHHAEEHVRLRDGKRFTTMKGEE